MNHELDFSITASSREDYRRRLTEKFLDEKPGNEGESSQYFYYVEKDSDGHRIYLKRPTTLNKGFDFEVCVEDVEFEHPYIINNAAHKKEEGLIGIKKTHLPSHDNILNDLKVKKKENPVLFSKARIIIDKLFDCQDVPSKELEFFEFDSGYKFDLICKCIKWLFIEQDITYWNWSGRKKLYQALSSIWEEE